MRICMVTSAPFPPREGMGFYVWNLSRYLIEHGNEVSVITRGTAGRTTRESLDHLTLWRVPFVPVYPFHVHLHGVFLSRLVHRLRRNVDVFHVHTPLPPLIPAGLPTLLTFHSAVWADVMQTPVNNFYALLMRLQAPVSFSLEVEHLRRARRITAVSPIIKDALRLYPFAPATVNLVWNGIDTVLFAPPEDATNREPVILTVSRLAPGKGIEDLVLAAIPVVKQNNQIQFLIAGDGPSRNTIQNLIDQNNLQENIHLLGHIADRQMLIQLYQKASLFLLPSHHEGMPTVVLEAMACGCPVISTNVGGVSYAINDGENGVLVPPKDPKQLTSAINSLLLQPDKRLKMGQRARETVNANFTWEVVGRIFLSEYLAILS